MRSATFISRAGRALFSLTVLAVLATGCLKKADDGAEPIKVRRRPAAVRQFDTMTVHATVDKFFVQPDGQLVHHSTDSLTFIVDAVHNRYRMEVTPQFKDEYELQVFDGTHMWSIVPKQRTIYKTVAPWPKYKVYDQAKPVWGPPTGQETLRGVNTEVYKNAEGTFWFYKGVAVQSHREGKKYVVRTTLQDVLENAPIPKNAFEVPNSYQKIQY